MAPQGFNRNGALNGGYGKSLYGRLALSLTRCRFEQLREMVLLPVGRSGEQRGMPEAPLPQGYHGPRHQAIVQGDNHPDQEEG